MTVEEAKQTVERCQKDTVKIRRAMDKVDENATRDLRQLSDLRNKLPELLADRCLGLKTGTEVKNIKRRISAIKESTDDVPVAKAALAGRLDRLTEEAKPAQKILQLEEDRQRYLGVREQIINEAFVNLDSEREFMGLARTIGKRDEAERLLRELRNFRSTIYRPENKPDKFSFVPDA